MNRLLRRLLNQQVRRELLQVRVPRQRLLHSRLSSARFWSRTSRTGINGSTKRYNQVLQNNVVTINQVMQQQGAVQNSRATVTFVVK